MKVVYVKRIDEKLIDAIRDAAEQGRKIDHIEITRLELDELGRKLGLYWYSGRENSMFMGVRLVEVN